LTDFDIIAREVSGYRTRFEAIEKRLDEVERVNARLEDAALTTARALGEISGHWNAVYEAMRRKDGSQMPPEEWLSGPGLRRIAGDVPDVLKLTFADGTTEQIEVERGRADQEFEDLRKGSGRYEGGWLIGESQSEKWKWLNIGAIVSVEIHRESDGDHSQPEKQ
jgi:hypothetical protein